MKTLRKCCLFLTFSFSLPVYSYRPPSSPDLYKPAATSAIPEKSSGSYVSAGLGLGQSRSTGGEHPKTAYGASLEGGFTAMTSTWNFWEAALQFTAGKLGHSEADLSVVGGLLARVGYGYTISTGLSGIWSLGAGILAADYENTTNGVTSKSTKTVLGSCGFLDFSLIFNTASNLALVGGTRWTHAAFNLEEVEVGGNTQSFKKPIGLNIPEIRLGVRWYI